MRIALCNEVLSAMEFADQCRYARALGYDGLEVAPYTLAEDPSKLSDVQCAAARHIAQEEGIAIDGLHWLLVKPSGLSITSPDAAIRRRTVRDHDAPRPDLRAARRQLSRARLAGTASDSARRGA